MNLHSAAGILCLSLFPQRAAPSSCQFNSRSTFQTLTVTPTAILYFFSLPVFWNAQLTNSFLLKPHHSSNGKLDNNNRTAHTAHHMYRGRRGRRGADPYATLLLVQLLQQIAQLERKPPVTLAAIAGKVGVREYSSGQQGVPVLCVLGAAGSYMCVACWLLHCLADCTRVQQQWARRTAVHTRDSSWCGGACATVCTQALERSAVPHAEADWPHCVFASLPILPLATAPYLNHPLNHFFLFIPPHPPTTLACTHLHPHPHPNQPTTTACFLAFYNELLPPPLRPPSVQHACLQPYLIVQVCVGGMLGVWVG